MLLFYHLVDQGCLRSWEHCCVCKVANKVKKRSLADLDAPEDDEMPGVAEQQAGLDLWHQYTTVVNLTVNVKASDGLGDLLQAMRDGPLPDKYWEMLQERQIGWHRVAGHASRE